MSAPIHTDLGYVVTSVKDIQQTHPATLAEVHDRVASDYRHEKAVDLAKSRAEELAKRAKGGENFAAAAKALGLDVKSSDPVAQTGSIPDLGSAKQFASAFSQPVGQTGDPIPVRAELGGLSGRAARSRQPGRFREAKVQNRRASFAAQAANSLRFIPNRAESAPPGRGPVALQRRQFEAPDNPNIALNNRK